MSALGGGALAGVVPATGGGGGSGPALSNDAPLPVVGADPGSSPKAARADHQHGIEADAVIDALMTAVSPDAGDVLTVVGGTAAWAAPAAPTAAQVAPLGLAGSLSVAGSGALSVSAAAWAYTFLDLTGALTGDRTLTLAAAAGRRCLFRNSSTGVYTLKIVGAGGGATYLLPGQSRELWLDGAGVLQGEGLRDLVFEADVSLIGKGNAALLANVALPALTTIDLCEAVETTATVVTGLSATVTAGTALDGRTTFDNVMLYSVLGTLGTLHGKDKTRLGVLMATDGYGWLPAAAALRWELLTSNSPTAGALKLLMRARWLG